MIASKQPSMKKLVLLGSGGHASVILSLLRHFDDIVVIGAVTIDNSIESFLGLPILGDDEVLGSLVGREATHFAMGLGSVGDASARIRCFRECTRVGLEPVTLVHPSASLDPSARAGDGTVILANCIVAAGSNIAENVIVNNGAIIEHGCSIEPHAHVATGACLGGDVTVGSGAHIGIGATVRQSIKIGPRAIVGAGAVVVKDVPAGGTVVGVPARPLVRKG